VLGYQTHDEWDDDEPDDDIGEIHLIFVGTG
jgi:hypothetical protein